MIQCPKTFYCPDLILWSGSVWQLRPWAVARADTSPAKHLPATKHWHSTFSKDLCCSRADATLQNVEIKSKWRWERGEIDVSMRQLSTRCVLPMRQCWWSHSWLLAGSRQTGRCHYAAAALPPCHLPSRARSACSSHRHHLLHHQHTTSRHLTISRLCHHYHGATI